MHEALLKRVQTALALAVLDGNRELTSLLDEVKRLLPACPNAESALVPLATVRDALEVAELAWQIDAAGDAGDTLNGLAFNLLPKLRALLPPGTRHTGGEGAEEDEDFRAQLKRLITPTGGAPSEGVGEEVEASGLAAEGSQDAGAIARPRREGQADSSGLTAEENEAAATNTTAGEEHADAEVPEPADWQFNRMLQHLGRNPA